MTNDLIHPWERAGLGKAPFKFVGMHEEVFVIPGVMAKAGGTCAYCSQGIRYVFTCVSADGKRFGVGCDCIAKVHHKGVKILSDAERALRNFKAEKRREAFAVRKTAAKATLAANPTLLTDRPHPSFKDKTLRDYVEWMLANAGLSGGNHVCRIIEDANKEAR
jgi:hypothetical protein